MEEKLLLKIWNGVILALWPHYHYDTFGPQTIPRRLVDPQPDWKLLNHASRQQKCWVEMLLRACANSLMC
jgi:hypothetical protein